MTTKTKLPVRTRRRAQITRKDVENIARLVAKRLTEAEACECLGIRPRTWYGWRETHKNQTEYSALLTRVRGQYLRANLAEIEKAAGGKAGVRPDWRAAAHLTQVVAPERYLPQQPQPALPTPAGVSSTLNVWIAAAYTPPRADAQAAVVDVPEVKALPPAPQDTPEGGEPKQ